MSSSELDAEREAHAPLGAELVDQQRDARCPSGCSKSSAGPPARTVAVDDLRHLEVRVDLGRDADQLALALEERDPLAQVLDHAPSLVATGLAIAVGRRVARVVMRGELEQEGVQLLAAPSRRAARRTRPRPLRDLAQLGQPLLARRLAG